MSLCSLCELFAYLGLAVGIALIEAIVDQGVYVRGKLALKSCLQSCFFCEHYGIPARYAGVNAGTAGAAFIDIIHNFGKVDSITVYE